MLQNIRDNSQGTMAKIIVGVIVITFALFGAESIVSGFGGDPELAVVNGEGISQVEFSRAIEFKRRQILSQMGANADPSLINEEKLKKLVRDELIDQKVLLVDAKAKSMAVSEQILNQQITSMPQFQEGGVYSNEAFLNVIRNFGMTTQEFKAWLTKQYILAQQRNAFVGSGFVLNSELDKVMEIDRQTRKIEYVELPATSLYGEVEVTEAELHQFFDEHQKDYMHSEKVDVDYILIDKEALLDRVVVSPEDVRALYDLRLASYVSEEERDSSHILVEITDDVSDEAALEKIKFIEGKLSGGADFASLAKEYSDDIGSKSEGGKLGFARRGIFDPAFEEALFRLDVGQVSAPIKSQFGYHLIKLHSVDSKPFSSFDEMEASLQNEAKRNKVTKVFLDLSEQLADISYASADLLEPSEALGVEVVHGIVLRSGGEGVLANSKLIDAAFADDVKLEGNNSPIIELDGDKVVVLRANKYHPESFFSFDEAQELVRERLIHQKASKLAKAKGEAIILAGAAGDSVGTSWEVIDQLSRNDNSLPPEIVKKAFTLKKPEASPVFGGAQVESGDYYSLRLISVNYEPAQKLTSDEMAQASDLVATQIGSQEYSDFNFSLKSSAEIEIN